jgi:hypothetical protein
VRARRCKGGNRTAARCGDEAVAVSSSLLRQSKRLLWVVSGRSAGMSALVGSGNSAPVFQLLK